MILMVQFRVNMRFHDIVLLPTMSGRSHQDQRHTQNLICGQWTVGLDIGSRTEDYYRNSINNRFA